MPGGDMWHAPRPVCPAHGPMQFDRGGGIWRCGGFDGEGCGRVARPEETEWQPLGHLAAGDIEVPSAVDMAGLQAALDKLRDDGGDQP